jgi:hypothetical protein
LDSDDGGAIAQTKQQQGESQWHYSIG